MNKKIQETKKKIIEALEEEKEFELSYWEEVCHSKRFKARSEEELREKFDNGELELDDKDIIDGKMLDDTLEIIEVEN